ncbi:hypothetical protein CJ030_MR3G015057 [Morella rubra]|uniref:DUF4050 domain-containing protein n=1 Tax=Morella rubra TaxID=262757 RepID=A0A6A1W4J6_9ROSI|nr:hypothetical protein CJ030_MR3G015057 [Morella rubra]
MPSSCCFRHLAVFHVTMNSCQQPLCHCRRECSFTSETTDLSTGSFYRNSKQPLEHSTPTDTTKQLVEKDLSPSVFVNHAALAWHENRRKWVGDQSRRSKTRTKDPIISWSMGYEDLLSNNEPFSEPIPLPLQVTNTLEGTCGDICCFSDIQREEKSVQKAIRDAAKRNDMGSAKFVKAMEYTKVELHGHRLSEPIWFKPIARTVGHLSKSAEVMKIVNNLIKAPEMATTMQEFSKEMTKAGVIEEFVNDAVDSALDSEDIEEETEEEVEKVLAEIAGETAAQLPEAVRKERIKVPAQKASTSQEEEAIAEGADDEEELEELRARLEKVLLMGEYYYAELRSFCESELTQKQKGFASLIFSRGSDALPFSPL